MIIIISLICLLLTKSQSASQEDKQQQTMNDFIKKEIWIKNVHTDDSILRRDLKAVTDVTCLISVGESFRVRGLVL